MFAGGPISWLSQRQKLVILSTTEAEYVSACEASKNIIWLRKLSQDISGPCAKPTILYVDNQNAIRVIKNPEFHSRTKHIDIRYHFIREKVGNNEISVKYVNTTVQLADIFTKALEILLNF